MHQIRPLAICIFRKDNSILVAEGYDPVKNETFYRPLGGGIEFGERAEDTIARELLEEISAEIAPGSLKYLGAVENIFTFNGIPGHEIVMIYDGTLQDPAAYQQEMIAGTEAHGEAFRALWKTLDEFGPGGAILYPDGLLDLLDRHAAGPGA